MFQKVLVANRGEIAVRVIRACRELGIRTVAVYSEADRDALHVKLADEAQYIGPAPSRESYLSVPAIITAAQATGADAVHPGYGFLAENAFFAEACEKWGLTFIGPRPDAIRQMGDKNQARELMRKAGVPVVPGSEGTVRSVDDALAVARQIGFPVLVKAAGGGGGRGIRIARSAEELAQAMERAASEAGAAFGTTDVYIEKYVEVARHIEVQVLGDAHGNIIHLGERECSLQRRRQKILEEAPAPTLSPEVRERIRQAGVAAARAVGYSNAGTVEFLYDESTGQFYFIEMNTRIQVEHPVTEMITSVDLVKEQIRVAAGQRLRLSQEDVQLRGAAIECRITAEDPDNRLLPSTGTVTAYEPPGGPWTRVDGMLYPGFKVMPHYDSLVGKLIVWGEDRSEAIARMERALGEFRIEGIRTSIPLHQRILASPEFREGRFHTEWLEQFLQLK
ncbi:acetyl-CoA carboxylase biotin carboxylase subunit [Caldinitratiruptor microaerophilus]|uniref:Biotin carboxylase n=1 Tax=Caldinitratiruptor microaerophilus TaxID=671077 RepID=A0AA35CLT9_9FIRM|nr:acetyl-CoA carboxylase biotin carboxylase subunit [Caldinitratiruptor microaerophilus]BDG60773.1 acetyl-CoA carboxylase biotin carboxylase subunit [Caldinitratiruptor microaerophilus]